MSTNLTPKRHTSERSKAASRRNGARSHGPRTPQGKARSAASRLRHGYYSQSMAVALTALGEDPAEFKRRFQSLIDTYQPADPLQMALVYRMMRAWWRMERFDRMAESAAVNHVTEAEKKTTQFKAFALMPVVNKMERLEPLVRAVLAKESVIGAKELALFQKAQRDLPQSKASELLTLLLRLRAPGTELDLPPDLAPVEPVPVTEGQERLKVCDEVIALLAPEIEESRQTLLSGTDPVQVQFERDGILAASEPQLANLQCGEDASLRQLRDALNLLMKAKKWTRSLEEVTEKQNPEDEPDEFMKTNHLQNDKMPNPDESMKINDLSSAGG